MDINLNHILIRDLVEGYENNGDDGVRGYSGKLDIRPPYQREFIYKRKQQEAVIDSILRDFPLNVMYWVEREDGTYEMLDGQQRTRSISDYVDGVFMVPDLSGDRHYFHGLPGDQQEKILNYSLLVYFCTGTETERLNWFETINISGEKLNNQEMRNAVYSGPWVTAARNKFSRPSSPAKGLAENYVKGSHIRQQFLQKAIAWKCKDGESIEQFMERHRGKSSADDLWNHFRAVIKWAERTFKYRETMKGVEWGPLYREFKNHDLDLDDLERQVSKLHKDDEVKKKGGIYPYVLTGDERHLNLRTFSPNEKQTAYEKQGGVCPLCKQKFSLSKMEGDHIVPWRKGGRTVPKNLQMLCRPCNRRKGAK